MTKRLYLDEARLAEIGMDAATIATIRKLTEFVALVTQTDTIDQDLTTLSATVAAEQALLDAAQQDIIDLEDGTTLDTRYVRQDQSSAWQDPTGTKARTTYATFAGQTITNPPTQAEVQAIDDHLKILSERVAALVSDLRSNGAISDS